MEPVEPRRRVRHPLNRKDLELVRPDIYQPDDRRRDKRPHRQVLPDKDDESSDETKDAGSASNDTPPEDFVQQDIQPSEPLQKKGFNSRRTRTYVAFTLILALMLHLYASVKWRCYPAAPTCLQPSDLGNSSQHVQDIHGNFTLVQHANYTNATLHQNLLDFESHRGLWEDSYHWHSNKLLRSSVMAASQVISNEEHVPQMINETISDYLMLNKSLGSVINEGKSLELDITKTESERIRMDEQRLQEMRTYRLINKTEVNRLTNESVQVHKPAISHMLNASRGIQTVLDERQQTVEAVLQVAIKTQKRLGQADESGDALGDVAQEIEAMRAIACSATSPASVEKYLTMQSHADERWECNLWMAVKTKASILSGHWRRVRLPDHGV